MSKLLLVLALLIPSFAFASEVSTVLAILGPFLSTWAEKYPLLADILGIMVTARLVMKPIMSALLTISKDAEFAFLDKVAEFSENKIYKMVAFVLDWLLSVKLPAKKK